MSTQAGFVRLLDAFAAPHGIDRYLEALSPLWSVTEPRAEIVAVRHQGARGDAVTLTLRANRSFGGFRAGQHLRVGVEVDGVRRTRCYSLAGSAHRQGRLLEITVKRQPGGAASNALVDGARPGQTLVISQAAGEVVLPEPRPARLVLISAGSGITPCLSMLRTLVDEGAPTRVTFLHYAPDAGDLLYAAELAELARAPRVELHLQFTRGAAPCPRFGEETLRRVAPDFAECESFLCGPQSLIDSATRVYAGAGAAARLQVERFTAQALPAPASAAAGEVRFARSERLSPAGAAGTLLERAEQAGLRPDSGCRMGLCMTCKCTKRSGVVRNLVTGQLSSDDGDEIQLCVSAPVGDVTLDL